MDIRSKNLIFCKYIKADFKQTITGHKKIKKLLISLVTITLTCVTSTVAFLAGVSQAQVLFYNHIDVDVIRPVFSLSLYIMTLYFTGLSTLMTTDLNKRACYILIPVYFFIIIYFVFSYDIASASKSIIDSLSLSLIEAIIGVYFTAFLLAFSRISCGLLVKLISLVCSGLTVSGLMGYFSNQIIFEFIITWILAIAVILTSNIIARKAVEGNQEFSWFREQVVFLAAIGGTSFYGSDLTDACFDGADLPHTDFRKTILTRTSFEGATRLDLSRLRGTILEQPNVRKLLTTKVGQYEDYTGANFEGASLKRADLTGAILKEVKALDADFSEATLTGACIENWSINSETRFTGVQCDYIYRELDKNGKPTARYPVSRNFEPGEFESLYQQVGNVVELIFQEGENWEAALFSLKKLQIEDEELGLELKGIEKRGDLWVVKVTHSKAFSRQEVELRLNSAFDEMKLQLAAKEKQINQLLGIVEDQAAALKNYSKQPLGTSNSFFIVGSTITNLSASGQIDYQEAVSQVRNVVANNSNLAEANHLAQSLLTQLQNQNIAPTPLQQAELIEQLILLEAQKDAFFKQIFVQQGQQFAAAMPDSAITTAVRNAIAQLTPR
uniref:Pentapeptide repeat-containing protein n=1 Tax=Desertifilum tharense IPPAS B-1220 TaxID=1781255 RepID=A0ACD5GXG8_9CYAN